MLTVSMQKTVTLIKELGQGRSSVWTIQYKELENTLQNENEITATYSYGQLKTRRKRLQDLGYKLKESIFYNDHAPWGTIREVWAR